MNKLYGICVTRRNIIDEINKPKSLEQYALVQVLYINESARTYTIKLLSEDTTTIKFNNHIYTCDLQSIQIVPHSLFLFLISADYGSRLNILQKEKEILDLRIDSKVTLKFIDSEKHEYAIEFVINYIGAIRKLGTGNFIGLNFAYFGRLRELGAILTKIHDKFHHDCDEVTSIIIVRAEQLFCDILLFEKSKNEINSVTQYSQVISDQTNQPKLINALDVLKLGNNITKATQCLGCDEFENLFKFRCGHPFCYKCILKGLDDINCNSATRCLNCYLVLQPYEELQFYQFLDVNLSEGDKLESKTNIESYKNSKNVLPRPMNESSSRNNILSAVFGDGPLDRPLSTNIGNNNRSSNVIVSPKNDELDDSMWRNNTPSKVVIPTKTNKYFRPTRTSRLAVVTKNDKLDDSIWRQPLNQSLIQNNTQNPKNDELNDSIWRRPVNQSSIRNNTQTIKYDELDYSMLRRPGNQSSIRINTQNPKNDELGDSIWRRPVNHSSIRNNTQNSKNDELDYSMLCRPGNQSSIRNITQNPKNDEFQQVNYNKWRPRSNTLAKLAVPSKISYMERSSSLHSLNINNGNNYTSSKGVSPFTNEDWFEDKF